MTLALTIYDRDGTTQVGTCTGNLCRVSDRARAEAAERNAEITDMLTTNATAASVFQRGGWVADADGTKWQLIAPHRLPGAANANQVRWQVKEEGAV